MIRQFMLYIGADAGSVRDPDHEEPVNEGPSGPLAAAVGTVAAAALGLPYVPALAGLLGFVTLPSSYAGYVTAATLTHLMLVEAAKRAIFRRHAV